MPAKPLATPSRASHIKSALRRAIKLAMKKLPGHPDVVGVTSGHRIKNGRETGEECLTVFVRAKKPIKTVSRKKRIQRFFFGRNRDGSIDRRARLYTDVVQIKSVKPLRGEIVGGGRIIVQGKTGTTAFAFTDHGGGGRTLLLSNRHVLAPKENGAGDRHILCRIDGDVSEIGTLADYFKLSSEGGKGFFDAALGRLNDTGISHVSLLAIQKQNGSGFKIIASRVLQDNESGTFWLCGGNSGVQNGTLWDRLRGGGTWNIEYDDLGLLTVNRLYGLKAFARSGDSGSPIFEKTGSNGDGVTLVGIAVAVAHDPDTGRTITLFHPIKEVETGFAKILGRSDFRFIS